MKKLTFLFAFILISLISISQGLDNEFYFRFGYSSPSWKQFGFTENEWLEEGMRKKTGGTFEIGTIFMINSLPSAENMALGIDVDYLYSNFNYFYSDNDFEFNFMHVRVGSKIGPSFTISPVNKLAFDVFAKANIAWATGAVYFEDVVDNADDFYKAGATLGFSAGLNIRYGILMLGIEYENIKPKLESNEYPGEYLGEFNDNTSDKSPLPCINFSLGLSF